MDDAPYRHEARIVEIGWHTTEEARAGADALRELLESRGVPVSAVEMMQLRAHADAYLEAEPDAAVFVGWGLGRVVNELLAAAGCEERLHRLGETSTRWMLTTPAEAERRRGRGDVLLDRPPPEPGLGRGLLLLAASLAVPATLVVALVATGEWWTLAASMTVLVASGLYGRAAGDDPATARRRVVITGIGSLVGIGGPAAVLAWRGELLWTVAVVAAALTWLAFRAALVVEPGRLGNGEE